MNQDKDCKVLFNSIVQRMWKKKLVDSNIDIPLYIIDEIINFIMKQSKTNRFLDLKGNKFCFLESASKELNGENIILIKGIFKSARNEFRPNLIHKKTGIERKNPKEIAEGDIEKTHFVIKIDKNSEEVFMFLEYNFHGINTVSVIDYFESFHIKMLKSKNMNRNSTIKYFIIPKNSFLTELETLSRTKMAEIYFDKQLLGSKALNFSNRFVSLKKELKLTLSASKSESITEVAIDLYNRFNSNNSDISKVRIYGVDEDNNEKILDTTFMGRVEFVKVDLNQETGEVNSSQLFTGLVKIANSF